jgi:hypothetical protein
MDRERGTSSRRRRVSQWETLSNINYAQQYGDLSSSRAKIFYARRKSSVRFRPRTVKHFFPRRRSERVATLHRVVHACDSNRNNR